MLAMRRAAVVRRRPLLRAAVVGGAAYMAGRATARRSAERADQQAMQQAPQPAPPPDAAAPGLIDQLTQLSTMHERGALTDDEFAAAKARLLG